MPWTEDPGRLWSTGLQSVRWEIPDVSWDLLYCKKFNKVSKYGPHKRKKERKKESSGIKTLLIPVHALAFLEEVLFNILRESIVSTIREAKSKSDLSE